MMDPRCLVSIVFDPLLFGSEIDHAPDARSADDGTLAGGGEKGRNGLSDGGATSVIASSTSPSWRSSNRSTRSPSAFQADDGVALEQAARRLRRVFAPRSRSAHAPSAPSAPPPLVTGGTRTHRRVPDGRRRRRRRCRRRRRGITANVARVATAGSGGAARPHTAGSGAVGGALAIVGGRRGSGIGDRNESLG